MDEAAIRELFYQALKKSGAYGAQLSIVKNRTQLDFAAGFAHAGYRVTMTVDTLMQVGSITKLFNAALLLLLVDRGLLELDAPVYTYLPGFVTATWPTRSQLTIRHLLSMSSGLDNGPYVYFGASDDALAAYVSQLKEIPQHFPPGEHFGYSNAGVCIAGLLASRATSMSWESLLREALLRPAGLSQFALQVQDIRNQSASFGHNRSGDMSSPVSFVKPTFDEFRSRAPSGATLALSTSNLARFGRLFVEGGTSDARGQVLPQCVVSRMMTPQIQTRSGNFGGSWCIGPFMDHWCGIPVYGHGGTTVASTSHLCWIPEHEGVIAFNVNTLDAMCEFKSLVLDGIAQEVFGIKRTRVDEHDVASPVATNRERYLGMYESLGTSVEVVNGRGSALAIRLHPKPVPNEIAVAREARVAELHPIAEDRFLVRWSSGKDLHRGEMDMAFFGADFSGRATNLLDFVFPLSRVD